MSDASEFLFSWNPPSQGLKQVEIEDDSLRDGLQGAFVRRPTTAQKIELLELSSAIGVQGAMLGFPASSPTEMDECRTLVREIEKRKLPLFPRFLARATPADVQPIIELYRESEKGVGADFFIAGSPIRRHVEGWSWSEVAQKISETARALRAASVPFSMSIEDTSRTPPADLEMLLQLIGDVGAHCVALCDTVGEATPAGAARLVTFTRDVIAKKGFDMKTLWHGHNDRGLALANSIAAAEAGTNIVGGSFLGIGERTGNAALEQFVLYLHQCGVATYSVDRIVDYCRLLAKYTDTPIADNAPIVGSQAFATCTGTHSAAILKARKMDVSFEDYIFSAVPASPLGRVQDILIGPTSGMANARYVLERAGMVSDESKARALLDHAKTKNRWLRPDEVEAIARGIQ